MRRLQNRSASHSEMVELSHDAGCSERTFSAGSWLVGLMKSRSSNAQLTGENRRTVRVPSRSGKLAILGGHWPRNCFECLPAEHFIPEATHGAAMLGIGGVGSVDLSAWIGLSGINNVPGPTAAPAVSAPMTDVVASVGLSANLQVLVQTLQQFSLAEILLALLLASNARRCDRRHEELAATDGLAALALATALSQQVNLEGHIDVASLVTAVGGQSAMQVNVAG